MKKLLLSIGFVFIALILAHSQCTNTVAFGTATAPTGTTATTISACTYQTEYNTVNSIVAGNSYTSTYSLGGCITVRSGSFNGPVVATGNAPLTWTATVAGTYYIHYNTSCSPTCGTATSCGTSTITCNSCGGTGSGSGCTNTSSFGSATAPTGTSSVTISTCNFQTEYSTISSVVAGSTYSLGSSCGGFITVHSGTFNGPIVASGNAPLNWAATTSGTFYVHYNTNSSCGTATNCCTTTITCSSCPPPPPPAPCGSNPAAGNTCATATPICDLDGYCGNTSATYSSNSWAELNTAFCGSIENNSFVSFVASATTVSLSVSVPTTNTAGWGIQMFFFSDANCAGPLTSIHQCYGHLVPGGPHTVTATGLTIGQTYTIMIDGYAGAVASYVISANTGVQLPVIASNDVTICVGQSANLSAMGGNGTYSWSPSTGLSATTGTNVTASPTVTTTYTVTSATGNPLCPSSTTDQVTVTVNSGSPLSMTGTSALSGSVGPSQNISLNICAGGSASLNAAGGTTYTWAPTTGLSCSNCANPTASPATTTTYTITSTNASGCPSVGYVTINVTPPPVLSVNSGTICSGASMVLTASGANTYSWSPVAGLSATTGASVTASPTSTTSYTVTGSNPGCPNTTATSTVTVTPRPTANFTVAGNFCQGASSVNFTNTTTNTTGATTYAWTFPSGTPASSTAANPTGVTWATPGTYNITLTATTAGCPHSVTIPITIQPAPTVTITRTHPPCNGGNGTITATGSVAGTFSWSSGQNTAGVHNVPAGSYTVTFTSAAGCVATATTTVTNPPVLAITATGTNPTCNGTCNGTLTANTATGGTAPYTYSWNGGLGAGQNKTGVCAGTYIVTVTDANNCTATASVTITAPPLITVATTQTNVLCNGACNGTINVTPGGGTGAYTYAWTGGLTGQNPTGVCAGTYTVTVSSPAGCSQNATVTITAPPALTVTASGTNLACNAVCNGTLAANASGGTGAVTYSWNGGVGAGANHTGECAGTYTVTATDANGCTATSSYTITQPTALTVTMANTPTTCNGVCTGTATATPAGGTSPYTYQWNAAGNLGTAASANALCAGAPSVVVTDANGCTVTGNTTVTQPTVLAITATGTNATCNGVCDGTLTANNATGGTAPYTYSWNGGLGAGQNKTGVCDGTYIVTVTDANGCSATATVTITEPPVITIATAQTNVLCNGACNGTINVTPGGGTGAYTYAWTGGLTGQNPTGVCAGSYTVTVSSPAGCTQTANVTITAPPALAITASGTDVLCNGACNGTLTGNNATGGTAPYTYSWNGGLGAGQNKTGVCAGTYIITVTDANNCTATASVTINQPVVLSVIMANTPASCNGVCDGTATATPSGGTTPYTYQWNAAGNLGTAITANALCVGAPSVVVTDANGCTVTGNTTITQPTAIVINTSSTPSTCGNADGQACATISGGTGPYTQSWIPGGQTGLCANLVLAGSYTITVTDANSCTQTATVNVSDAGAPTATITASTNVSCNGGTNGSATVVAAGGTAPYTYLWNGGSTPTATSTNGLSAGTASVVVTDANGCQANASVAITQPTTLTAAITSSTNISCNAGNNGTATVTANGGTAPYTYSWNNSPSTTVTATGLSAGVSQVVTVTDANGCIITANITLTQPVLLTVNVVGTNTSCNGVCDGTATATVAGGTAPYSYLWDAAGNSSTSANAASLCAGAPTLIVTDANGCTANGGTTITEPTLLTIATSSTPSTCGNADGQACATISGGTGPYTQSWTPSGQTGLCANSVLAGSYTITVTDANSCTQTATVNVSDAGAPTATITASTNVSCNGGTNGSASVVAAGGTAPYTYLWNGGSTPTATSTNGLSAGTASVVVTDANGCQANASVVITEPTVLTAAITASTNVSCNAGNNGSATVTANGGTSPYTYSWNNSPSTTVTASGLLAGVSQIVTVTDANGCIITANVTLTEPTALGGAIVASNPLCNGACDGSADLTPTGGTAPYTYSWNDPATTTSQDATGLCAGSFNAIITDANGCQFTASTTLTNPVAVTLTSSATDAHCNQTDGQVCVTPVGGTGAYTYIWNDPSNQTTACANNVGPGSYSVTVTDANGCSATTSQAVANIAGPSATASVVSNTSGAGICDGSATVTVANGSAPFLYSWDTTPSQTNQNATGLCAGTYCVTVTDAFGCTSVSCVTVTEPDALVITITPTDLLCNGVCNGQTTTVVSGGIPPYTFSWAHGPTAANLTGLCAGTYNLTVTDANGITGTQSVTIAQPSAIVVASLTSTPVLCNGACDGTITANANGGTGALVYSWTGGLANGTNPTSVCAGPYTLTVTDANNCTVTGNVNVAQPTPLILNTNSTNSNCGQPDGQACIVISGGTAPYSQVWDDASAQTTLCASNVPSGSYQVSVNDANGCTASATVTVSDNSAGTASATVNNNVFCNGDCTGSATATMTGGQAPFTYLWTSGATPTAATTAGLCVGNTSVTITDANGCSSTTSVNITEPVALSTLNSFTPVSCNSGSNGTVSTVASWGTSAVAYTYSWVNQTTSAVVGTTPSVNGLSAGTYCVTVTDDNNCTANACAIVTEPDAITMTPASTNSNCAQANGTLSVTGIVGGSGTYVSTVWTNASSVVVANPNAVLAGSYTVTVTDDNGCIGTANINVNDLTGPTASFVSAANTLCNGDCNGQGVANVSGGVAPYTLVWSPAPASGQGTLSIGGLCADDYTLLATDAAGCASTITISITEPTVVGLNTGTITATSGAGICDGTANVVASGGTTPYSYAWFTTCANTTPTGVTAASSTGLCAGSYGVIVTDVNGCTADVCVTISSPNAITSTVAMTPTLCNTSADGSLTVTPNGGVPGYTYQWFVSPANTPIAGQTAATATNLASGNYYVVVTDANGITHTSDVTAVTSPTAVGGIATVTSNYNGFGVSCETTCNGTALASPLGGTAPYTYDWGTNAGNQTTQSATNLCFGIYDVTVTDANGCTGVLQVTISKPPTFVSSITFVNDPCNATCAGSATVSTIGGIAPVSYQWDNPALSTTATASGLCAGNYNAIITDANGCVLNETATISEPAAIVLAGNSQGSNCNQNDGSATVSVVSGAGPFTYLWDANAANQTTATATNLFAGCYDVVVTDGTGCTENIQVCVNDLGAPTATILTQTDVSCNGVCDGFAQIQIIGGTAPYNYTWVDSNGNPTGVTTASNNTLCAGVYTGQMVDANGCQASVGVTINQPLALNGLISASADVTCFGDCDGSATATISGGTAPYTYQWNDVASQTTATATNLCPGTYSVNVIDAQGCSFTLNTTIAEPAQIIINATSVDAFCNTGTGSATAVLVSGGIAPMNYSWNDPNTQNAITALNLVPGNYIVTATDADGCSNTENITVGNIPAGTATLTNINDVLCFSGSTGSVSVSMSGTGTAPYSYNWFNSSGLAIGQTGITATNLPTGNYYVEVTDANNCISVSNTVLINQPTLLNASVNAQSTLCNGNCDGTAQAFGMGGVAPYTFQWDDALSQNIANATNLCVGTYTVTVVDFNGCVTSAQGTIDEPSLVTVNYNIVDANCGLANGSGCLIPSGGIAPYTYIWPDNSTNSCQTGLLAGSYCVEVRDFNGCLSTHCINIQDLNGPSATILNTVNVSCNAGNDGSATVDMIGGNGFFTAQWDNNAGNQVTPTASNLAAGTYGVTITDSIGCTAATSVTILEPDALVSFQVFNNPSCFQACDGTAQINVVGGTQPYSYSWTNNLNTVLGTNASVSNLCQGSYNLTLNDANGCNQILNYVITDPVQVTGTVASSNVTCFGACDGTITATGVNGVAPFSYQWDAAAANQTTATASGLCPGTYTCTITDANGCTNTVTGTITEPTLLTADIPTSQNVSCFGLNNGFANALGAGGTLPYSYSWNNSAGTNATATNLVSGNYEVTITDANGCTAQSDVFIAQPTQLSATSSKTNVTCFGACNGTASVAVSGGTPSYTYQWDNAGFSTTAGISNLCNGTYNVIITDANNCQISTSVNITQPTDVNISATITNSNCGQNNGQICVNTFGGTFPMYINGMILSHKQPLALHL
jgi:hypothetical protein